MKRVIKSIKLICSSFQYLLYPPFCIHCKKALPSNENFLCDVCVSELIPLDNTNRCPHCYLENDRENNFLCFSCQISENFFSSYASVFDYEGPASSIIKKLKYADMPHLNKGAGAYMAVAFLKLKWVYPDYIIPVPISLSHKLQRGYNQSLLLAQELSNFIHVPINDCLLRKKNSFSQASLLRYQREKLSKEFFFLKHNEISLEGKTVLLVDDVYTTGKTGTDFSPNKYSQHFSP